MWKEREREKQRESIEIKISDEMLNAQASIPKSKPHFIVGSHKHTDRDIHSINNNRLISPNLNPMGTEKFFANQLLYHFNVAKVLCFIAEKPMPQPKIIQ